MKLNNKVALVTGGSQGIGKAISEMLLSAGAAVAIAAIDDEALNKTAGEFESKGFRFKSYGMDLTDDAQVEKLVADIARDLGPCDILINNAGITGQAIDVSAGYGFRIGE